MPFSCFELPITSADLSIIVVVVVIIVVVIVVVVVVVVIIIIIIIVASSAYLKFSICLYSSDSCGGN